MKYFICAIIGIVGIAIISGFLIAGSPKEERLRKFDERRVENLRFIQSEIVNFWQHKNKLPEGLSDIRDDIRGIVIPRDPETRNEYEYSVQGRETFTLCAAFDRPTFGQQVLVSPEPVSFQKPFVGQQNWDHGSGHICFERTIDKEYYKPINPPRGKP